MTTAKMDKDTRWDLILAAFFIGGLAVGGAAYYIWKPDDRGARQEAKQSRYLTLGEHRLAIGDRSMLVQLSIEYIGSDTGKSLAETLPRLKNEVGNLLSGLTSSDLTRLRTLQGKKALAGKVLELVRGLLPDEDAGNVKGILYEKFLIGD